MVLCLPLFLVVPIRSVITFYPLEVKQIEYYDIILSMSATHHYTLLGENKENPNLNLTGGYVFSSF